MSVHVDVECAQCHAVFCVPVGLHAELRRTHRTFYCPRGHSNYYPQKTAEQKKIERLERELGWERQAVQARDRTIAHLEREVRSLRSRLAWARRRPAETEQAA